MENISLEQIKAIKEVMDPRQNRDSFTQFTGGLRENWIFLVALFTGFMFLVTSQYENKNIDAFQTKQIESNIGDIAQLQADVLQNDKNIQTLNLQSIESANKLENKVDSIQQTLDQFIKSRE